MLNKLLNRTEHGDFVVIDSTFPQQYPFAFRNTEINEYFNRINNFASYTMFPMKPDADAWFTHGYGMTIEVFTKNKEGYLQHFKGNADKIFLLDEKKRYSFKLAYSYFLAETYVLLPFYEKHKIPFVFVLYPGGSFGMDFDKSDSMLRKIFSSKYFKHVIVTQQITKDYLIKNKLCTKERIKYIYGGFVQFKKEGVQNKKYYKKDKKTFDICFVAAKYSKQGADKGYDLFIKTAKIISKKTKDVMFHVVGDFSEQDIPTAELRNKITFYGYQGPDFLSNLYADMDIALSPNRPHCLYKGNFDGFPLGIDAGYCGVALFVADELKMNTHYLNNKDIVIVDLSADKIADQILYYYNDLESLYSLAKKGQKRTQELFDIDYQIDERIKVFSKYVDLELN